jgi:MFS family permease
MTPLGVAVCLSLFGDLTLFAVLVDQLSVVGLSLGAAGIMLGVHRLLRIGANPVAGLLFDRRGRRPMFLLGMVLAVLSTLGYAMVRGFWPFLVTRLAWGLAWTLLHVGGLAMVLDISERANRGRWMGVYNTWVLAGLALGPVVGGLLVDAIGFRPGMLVCAGLSAIGLAVALLFLPETAPPAAAGQEPRPAISALKLRLGLLWLRRVRPLLRANPGLITAAGLYLIVQFTGEGVVLSTITLLLRQRFGERLAVGTLVMGVASAGGLLLGFRSLMAGVAGPLAGHLSDSRWGRWPTIVGSLFVGLAGFALLAFARSPVLLVVGVALGAVSAGAILASLAALVGDLTPPGREGAVMGFYAGAGDVGSTAGPFLAFALVAAVDLRWVYASCAATFLAGLGLIASMRRANHVQAKEQRA